MIRPTRTLVSGRFKYVYMHREAEALYDLAADPEERMNIASSVEQAARCESMRDRCLRGGDPDDVEDRIHESQKLRRFLNEALSTGAITPWDYQPFFDAARMNVRRDLPAPPRYSSLDQSDPSTGGG